MCLAAGRVTVGELTDHIVPKDERGSDERANLQRLCRACHKRKTDEDKSRAALSNWGHRKSGRQAQMTARP
jgi:5-methylcytosine-specific restriction protein A